MSRPRRGRSCINQDTSGHIQHRLFPGALQIPRGMTSVGDAAPDWSCVSGPLLAPLRGAIVIPFVSRWYRPLSRTQPPANGFEPSGFAFDRCSKRSAPFDDALLPSTHVNRICLETFEALHFGGRPPLSRLQSRFDVHVVSTYLED
jgi:hypothetical protein